jgi:hypothetical protein
LSAASNEPEYDLEAIIRDLAEPLNRLRQRLDGFQLRFSRYAADLSLYGFLLSAWENASAAFHILTKSEVPFACYPSARAAFESAEDALLLASSPNYNRDGARARVFEHLELADLSLEMSRAFSDPERELPYQTYDGVSTAFADDASHLNAVCPGLGEQITEAFAYFRPKFEAARAGKGRHPGHWSELSRRAIAKELVERGATDASADQLIAAYADLSRNTHPRLRLENWDLAPTEGKRLVRSQKPSRRAAGSTLITLHLAHQAADLAGQPQTEP